MKAPTTPQQLIDAVRYFALFERTPLQAETLRNIADMLSEQFEDLQQQLDLEKQKNG